MMTRMRLDVVRILAAAAVLALPATALAGGDGWITNMDDAMAQAKAEDKVILMDFTGSDWCGWCIKLDNEVFSQSLFKEYAAENLVLVELDFPRNVELSEEQKKHNDAWRDKIGIQGYPTIILADHAGEEFARTGYRPDGPAPYVDYLSGLVKGKSIRDAALAAAAKVDGIARAKMLDWALSIEGITVPNTMALWEEIITLDSEDLAGLRTVYQDKLNDMKVDEAMMDVQALVYRPDPDVDAAFAKLEEVMRDLPMSPTKAGELVGFRVMMLAQAGRTEEAIEAVEKFLALEDAADEAKQQVAAAGINVYLAAQRWDEAIAVFDKVIELGPDTEVGKMMGDSRQQFMDYVTKSREGTLESIPATKMVVPDQDDDDEEEKGGG